MFFTQELFVILFLLHSTVGVKYCKKVGLIPLPLLFRTPNLPLQLSSTSSCLLAQLGCTSTSLPPYLGSTSSILPPQLGSTSSCLPPQLGSTSSCLPPQLGSTSSCLPLQLCSTSISLPPQLRFISSLPIHLCSTSPSYSVHTSRLHQAETNGIRFYSYSIGFPRQLSSSYGSTRRTTVISILTLIESNYNPTLSTMELSDIVAALKVEEESITSLESSVKMLLGLGYTIPAAFLSEEHYARMMLPRASSFLSSVYYAHKPSSLFDLGSGVLATATIPSITTSVSCDQTSKIVQNSLLTRLRVSTSVEDTDAHSPGRIAIASDGISKLEILLKKMQKLIQEIRKLVEIAVRVARNKVSGSYSATNPHPDLNRREKIVRLIRRLGKVVRTAQSLSPDAQLNSSSLSHLLDVLQNLMNSTRDLETSLNLKSTGIKEIDFSSWMNDLNSHLRNMSKNQEIAERNIRKVKKSLNKTL